MNRGIGGNTMRIEHFRVSCVFFAGVRVRRSCYKEWVHFVRTYFKGLKERVHFA